MKLNCCTIMAAVIAVTVAACMPAFGQMDLVKGENGQTDTLFGIYSGSESGNQSTTREFDGRDYRLWGVELLKSYGYSGDYQYWLDARDLLLKDNDILFNLAVRNELSLNVSSSGLTHRLDRTPGLDPYLSPFGMSTVTPGASPPGTTTRTGNSFVDLTPDNTLHIRRRVNDFGVRLTPGSNKVALVIDWWQESENGLSQVNYRSQLKGSRLESMDYSVNRKTEQTTLGTDLKIGSGTVINYKVMSNQFSDSGSPLISGDRPDNMIAPNVNTSSTVIKARSRLSHRLYFTGAMVNRKRSNQTATLLDGTGIDTSSTNASLNYTASDNLSLTGSYRSYVLDNHVDPVIEGSGVTNVGLNHRERSLKLDAGYTGIPKAVVGVGYENRTTERTLNDNFSADPALEEVLAPKTDAKISYLKFNYTPTWKLNFTGRFENWNIDDPAFTASPADRTKAYLSSTYTPSVNLAFYADYNHQHDGRKDAEGLDNKITNATIGAWYSLSAKVSLDTFYATGSMDSLALWQLDDNAGGLLLEDVPYKSRNKQWSVGLNYAPTQKTKLYGRYLNSDSDGETTILTLIPGDPALPSGWAPVNVVEKIYTIGYAYEVSAKNRMLVDYSVSDWNDKIDLDNNGRYSIWRLAWSTTY